VPPTSTCSGRVALALAFWHIGYPDQALSLARERQELARTTRKTCIASDLIDNNQLRRSRRRETVGAEGSQGFEALFLNNVAAIARTWAGCNRRSARTSSVPLRGEVSRAK
jgi:hypothetical protein